MVLSTAAAFARPAGAAPEVAAKPSSTLAASVDDLFNNHLALDLDDDCLRLLLGEDADESAPCVSAGSGKAGSGASEKSSGTAAGEADAASHEDDDIAMLFGEMRWVLRRTLGFRAFAQLTPSSEALCTPCSSAH
jgi:hypothetical protein